MQHAADEYSVTAARAKGQGQGNAEDGEGAKPAADEVQHHRRRTSHVAADRVSEVLFVLLP